MKTKMRKSMRAATAAVALAAALAPLAAPAAGPAWRCGSTYTDQPCPGGRAVEVDDARDPSSRREAERGTREARSAADRLERDRLAAESATRGRQATLLEHRRTAPAAETPRKPLADARKHAARKADFFNAHDPVATARNQAEKKAEKKAKTKAEKRADKTAKSGTRSRSAGG